ncbi:MAG: energy transducer TonB [Bacteroidales bacterium]|nr:energy transducer TonB [Bacteroidales bacterium]
MGSEHNKQNTGKRVGLYLTLIFHLVVLIVMLLVSINSMVAPEASFVLDFTKQEQIEQEQKIIALKEDISRKLDNLIAIPRGQIRNIAVDVGSQLKDDRHSNPDRVYEEARELQRKLDASKEDALKEKSAATIDLDPKPENEKKQKEEVPVYKGPSVISYLLEGRKAQYLPVPAYKGYGSGDIFVEIVVNPRGRVIDARVLETISSPDKSLHDFAIDAAKRSRFTASESFGARHIGEIHYRFIGQN